METLVSHTNICQDILKNYILARTYAHLPPDLTKVASFTMKESNKLSDNIMTSSNFQNDFRRTDLKEDFPIEKIKNRKNSLLPLRESMHQNKSVHALANRSVKNSISSFRDQNMGFESSDLRLIPLSPLQNITSQDVTEENEVQQRLRQRKVHQQFLRTKYMQNIRPDNNDSKMRRYFNTNNSKSDSSKNQIIIYDFDGNVIQPNTQKTEGTKHHNQQHFVDVQVSIVQKDQILPKDTKKKVIKKKITIEPTYNKQKYQNLKKVESLFLRDIETMRLSDGVQFKQSKEECRNILGYKASESGLKKNIDLLKTSEQPIQIKFQELQQFKTRMLSGQEINESESMPKPKEAKKYNIMNQKSELMSANQLKEIKVTNTSALQMLISKESQHVWKNTTKLTSLNEKQVKKIRFME